MTAATLTPGALRGLDAVDQPAFDKVYETLSSSELSALHRLYDWGEVTERSPSDADWRLLCLLATGGIRDPEQLLRVALTSGIADRAELWHDGRPAATATNRAQKWARLGPATAVKAIAATEREYRKRQAQAPDTGTADHATVRSLADFLRDPDALKPPPAVITRTAWAGRVTLLASPEGWGKSTYVKAGCAAVTTGQAFLGTAGGPPGTVLWVRAEESEYDLMVNAHRFGADPARFVAWTPGPEPLAELTAEIHAHPWTVVVVDSIHEFALRCGVSDLDDGAQVSPVLQPLVDAARAVNAAMIWTGQANKATGSYRNSSTFGHMPDVVLEIVEPTESSPQRKFRQKKSRFDSHGFTVEQVNNTYQLAVGDPWTGDLGPRISKERRRILDALKPATGRADWLAAYGGKKDTFSSGVRWLGVHEYVGRTMSMERGARISSRWSRPGRPDF